MLVDDGCDSDLYIVNTSLGLSLFVCSMLTPCLAPSIAGASCEMSRG